MEPLFINETLMNKKLCNQVLCLRWRSSAKVIRGVMFGLGVGMFLFGFVNFLLFGMLGQFLSSAIFSGVVIFLVFWGHVLQAKAYFMRQSADWGEDSFEKTVTFYEEKIVQTTNRGEITFEYNKVQDFFWNKNVFIIKIADGSLVLSAKGFTTGSPDKFIQSFTKMADDYKEKHPRVKKSRFKKK